ncbi:hypothetical protein EJD97_005792 [Solanum chilense]|uniref:Uncharacterized protein n=1 Tax=Solanum chilense TaxID=4083 RepID=A0A6N2BRU4_SOLCI|nr:hypothetical protein EJD97_005792 [Solanum chilense]
MASSPAVADGELDAKSIRTVDLRLLSQSELYSLSLCSTTDYNPCRDDDFIIPKIDHFVFNEFVASSSSRTRTRTRTRTPHPPSLNNNSTENSQVVEVIKQLFGYPTDSVTNRVDNSDSLSAPTDVLESENVGSIRQKKKRGSPGKSEIAGRTR